jgi:hypothetical protein
MTASGTRALASQGNEQNHVDGYIEAALEFAVAILDKKLVASRDTLAMPILYNGRHALELSLKFAINRLLASGSIASRRVPNHYILRIGPICATPASATKPCAS